MARCITIRWLHLAAGASPAGLDACSAARPTKTGAGTRSRRRRVHDNAAVCRRDRTPPRYVGNTRARPTTSNVHGSPGGCPPSAVDSEKARSRLACSMLLPMSPTRCLRGRLPSGFGMVSPFARTPPPADPALEPPAASRGPLAEQSPVARVPGASPFPEHGLVVPEDTPQAAIPWEVTSASRPSRAGVAAGPRRATRTARWAAPAARRAGEDSAIEAAFASAPITTFRAWLAPRRAMSPVARPSSRHPGVAGSRAEI